MAAVVLELGTYSLVKLLLNISLVWFGFFSCGAFYHLTNTVIICCLISVGNISVGNEYLSCVRSKKSIFKYSFVWWFVCFQIRSLFCMPVSISPSALSLRCHLPLRNYCFKVKT